MTLAEEILLRVEAYGGVEKVIRDINREWGFFLGFTPCYDISKRGATPTWSLKDDVYLQKWYRKHSTPLLCKRLNRSKEAVYHRIKHLGLNTTA